MCLCAYVQGKSVTVTGPHLNHAGAQTLGLLTFPCAYVRASPLYMPASGTLLRDKHGRSLRESGGAVNAHSARQHTVVTSLTNTLYPAGIDEHTVLMNTRQSRTHGSAAHAGARVITPLPTAHIRGHVQQLQPYSTGTLGLSPCLALPDAPRNTKSSVIHSSPAPHTV